MKGRKNGVAEKKNWLLLIGILLLTLLLLFYLIRLNENSPVLNARAGIIAVPSLSPDSMPYMLTGEWFMRETGGETDAWEIAKNLRFDRRMRGFTYRFTLALENPEDGYYFLLTRPFSSRLWINGVVVQGMEENGTISSADMFRLADYESNGTGTYEFTLEANSQSLYDGYQGVLLGSRTKLLSAQNLWLYLDLIAIGLHLMLVLFMVVMFLQKRSEKHLLLLAFTAAMYLILFLSIPRYPSIMVFPRWSPVVMRQFYVLSYFVCLQFVVKPPRAVHHFVLFTVGVCVLSLFCASGFAMTVLRYAGYVQMLIQGYLIAKSLLRGAPSCGILLWGWGVSFIVEAVFYLLLNKGLIPQGMVDVQVMPTQYAQFAYLFALVVAATGKFARKFQEADELNALLEKKVEEQTSELVSTNERLMQVQSRKQRFMTDIVHNLRSPLFALGGYLDMLKDALPVPTAGQEKYLTLIDGKITSLENMADDIFLVSRLDDNAIEFNFVEFQLSHLIQSLVADAGAKALERRIDIIIKLEDTGLTIVGDAFRLGQALDNILDNAIRHSPEGGVVQVNVQHGEKHTVEITVLDHGPGIPKDQIHRLFERYVKGPGGSTGLGLAIAKSIVRAHGGDIRVQSNPQKGSAFTVTLPVSDEPIDKISS